MDISQAAWNEVDASNTAAAPDGSPENMAPSGVNNVLRAHQGAIKRNWKRSSVMVTTGTSSAYLVTHTVPPTALADGETDLVSFHAANIAGATLNVGALGAKPLHYYAAGAWRLVPAALWGADFTTRVAYHSASSAYRLLDLPDRTGEVTAFAGATAPAGSLLCYGQAISRTAYAGLFATLATTHGVGDGTTTFNLPDLRGRAVAGKSNMGGSDAGNLSGGATLGAGLGAQTHTLTADEVPSLPVTLAMAATGTGPNGNKPQAGDNTNAIGGTESVANGGGGAHNNVQPTRVLNYVIRI